MLVRWTKNYTLTKKTVVWMGWPCSLQSCRAKPGGHSHGVHEGQASRAKHPHSHLQDAPASCSWWFSSCSGALCRCTASVRSFLIFLKALIPGPLLPSQSYPLTSLCGCLPEPDFHMIQIGFQRARQVYNHVATHSRGEGNLEEEKNSWRRQEVTRGTSYVLHFQGTKATRWLKCTLSPAQRAPAGLVLYKLKPTDSPTPEVVPIEKKKPKTKQKPNKPNRNLKSKADFFSIWVRKMGR